MVLLSEWCQVEVIDLVNDGTSLSGLGFILVGGKSTGVVIKALIPGGTAERDGRLQCGDHVLQIGDVNLRGKQQIYKIEPFFRSMMSQLFLGDLFLNFTLCSRHAKVN